MSNYLMVVVIEKGKYALLFYKPNQLLYTDVVSGGFTVIQHEEITGIVPVKENELDNIHYYSQASFTDNHL